MKVFISWSGTRSKALAIALKDWLPLILQYVTPWVSDKDISAGERWAQAIAGELESSNFGILCITPENIKSEWIMFEAGALSKSMLDAKVIPVLFELELSDLSGPLSQFQALKVDQAGMESLVKSINHVAETPATDLTMNRLIPALWPELAETIREIPDKPDADKHIRPQTEVLEDLVSQVRGFGSRLTEFNELSNDREWDSPKSKRLNAVKFDLEEMMSNVMAHGTPEFSIVVLIGYLRSLFPWLAEVLAEANNQLRTANKDEARDIHMNTIEVVERIMNSRFGDRIARSGKQDYLFFRELPRLVDHVLRQKIGAKFGDSSVQKGAALF